MVVMVAPSCDYQPKTKNHKYTNSQEEKGRENCLFNRVTIARAELSSYRQPLC